VYRRQFELHFSIFTFIFTLRSAFQLCVFHMFYFSRQRFKNSHLCILYCPYFIFSP
jgi:hypothetical protein